MGNISAFFKQDKKKTGGHSATSPYITDTGYSNIDGHKLTLDPSIRGIQNNALQNYASLYGDFGNAANRFIGQTSGIRRANTDLRGRYLGNQGELVNARLRPVQQEFATLRGDTQQGLGRRGLSGSSFQTQALTNIDRQKAFAEGDVRAQAAQEGFNFENQLNQFESQLNAQELQALNNAAEQRMKITGETLEVAKARLLQEMGAFGIGTQNQYQETQRGTAYGISGTLGIK